MIKELRLTNFKALSLSEDYGKLNLFSGPCGSGKSARLQAIQWAITGTTSSDPGGNKPTTAAKWCAGQSLSCQLLVGEMDVFRSISIDPDGGISHNIAARIPGKRVTGREADYLIGDKLGHFMPMWRLSEFTSLSPELRRQMILRLCAEAGGALKTTEIVDQVVREAAGEPGDDRLWLRKKLEAASSTWAPTEALPALTAAIKAIISDSRSAADGADAASRSLSDRRTYLGVLSGTIDQGRADKAAVDAQIEAVVAQRSSQQGRATARSELQRMLVENGERQEGLDEQAAAHAAEDVESMMARALMMEHEAIGVSAAIADTAPGPPPADVYAMERALLAANCRQHVAVLTLDTTQGKIDRLKGKIAGLESSDWLKVFDLAQNIQGEYNDRGEFSSNCEEIVSLAMDNGEEDLEQARMALFDLSDPYRDAQIGCDQAVRAVAQAIIDRDTGAAQVSAYNARRDEWEAMRNNEAVRSDRLRREAAEIRETLGKRADRLAELFADRQECDAARIDLERRLNEIDSAGGIVSEIELDAQERALRDQSAKAECRITALIKASTIDAEMKAAIVRGEKANRELALVKRAMDAIKIIRETLMNGMLSRLLNPIAEFLAAAGRAETPYTVLETPTGAADFGMGWVREGTRISMEAMSDGERVLWGAGLAYALTLLANPPLKVLLIEAAESDELIGRQLFTALESVSAKLNNVFLATCAPVLEEDVPTWNYIATPTESHKPQTALEGQKDERG